MSTTHQLKSAEERIAAMNTVKQMLNNSNISGSKIKLFKKICKIFVWGKCLRIYRFLKY